MLSQLGGGDPEAVLDVVFVGKPGQSVLPRAELPVPAQPDGVIGRGPVLPAEDHKRAAVLIAGDEALRHPSGGQRPSVVVRHASKLGQHGCCVYLGPEDQVEWSEIAGTLVSIGYRAMPYGPYDSATHEPAGYYDMYVAQFALDGICNHRLNSYYF